MPKYTGLTGGTKVREMMMGEMAALYTRYKESGLIYDRLYTMDNATLSAEQRTALILNLEKLRGMEYQKMKQLKAMNTVAV